MEGLHFSAFPGKLGAHAQKGQLSKWTQRKGNGRCVHIPAKYCRIKEPVISLTTLYRRLQKTPQYLLEEEQEGLSHDRSRLQADFLPACVHSMRQPHYGILVMHCKWRLSFIDSAFNPHTALQLFSCAYVYLNMHVCTHIHTIVLCCIEVTRKWQYNILCTVYGSCCLLLSQKQLFWFIGFRLLHPYF